MSAGLDDVDRLGPLVEGTVDVGHRAGPQQRQQGTEAEVGGDAGRLTQAEGERGAVVEAFGTARDDGTAVGLDHLHRHAFLAPHVDVLGVPGCVPPGAVGSEGLHPRPGAAQPLLVQVLVVGHGVGDGPGDGAGVAEVGDAGDAGHGEADDVELRAGQVDLLVDAGVLDPAVRVARDDGLSGDGPLAGHQPAVAAGGAGAVGGEQADGLGTEVPCGVRAPEFRGEPGEEDVGGQPDGERGPGLPTAGGQAGLGELGCAVGACRETVVDAVGVRPYELRRLGVPFGQRVEAAAGGVGDAGAAGENVPGEGVGAEEGGGGALGAVAFDLQLPGAVEGGDPALGAGEFRCAAGSHMRDAPGVSVEPVDPASLGGHPYAPFLL
ncbi:hypothetical protein RKD49_003896 [Streptomyces glaucescens]